MEKDNLNQNPQIIPDSNNNKKRERKGSNHQGLRALAAFMDGMRCVYCGVPTAATIEHVEAFSKGGVTQIDNLKIACPYCNTRKGDMEVEDFKESERWKLELPKNLPETVSLLLLEEYNYSQGAGIIRTSSTNSRLKIEKGDVFLEIRAGRRYDWETIFLGKENHPKVVAATYDFLHRHYTTEKTILRGRGGKRSGLSKKKQKFYKKNTPFVKKYPDYK